MSSDNKKTLKNFILICITAFGLFTIIASGGGSSSSSSGTSSDNSENSVVDQGEAIPPTVEIFSPNNDSSYNSGSYINFIGSAKNYEDNIISEKNLVWTSSIDGRIGTGNILESKVLTNGNHEIRLIATDKFGNASSASISVTLQAQENNAPSEVTIKKPEDGQIFNASQFITFEGSAFDEEDENLTGDSLTWYSTIDQEIGKGEVLKNTNLSGGSHEITLIAEDSKGLQSVAEYRTIVIKNTKPTAKILGPDDDASYNYGNTIYFNGEGTDHEDGDLFGSNLNWISSLDGNFDSGRTSLTNSLRRGIHKITLSVTDSDNAVTTDSISITIN